MSIFKKLFSLVVGTVLCLVLTLVTVGYLLISRSGDETARKQLATFSDSMQSDVDNALEVQGVLADLLERDLELAEALAKKDAAAAKAIAKKIVDFPIIDLVTLCDMDGRVLARGHDNKAGDLLGPNRVSSTVPLKQGKRIVGIEPGNVIRLTLAVGMPIFYQGKQVGAAILGTDMSSGGFVESVKKSLGVEATIFLDDTRVSTTVKRDGKPVIDTKLNNPAIYDAVMKQGRKLVTRNAIAGAEYDTIYWPWKDMNGKNAGMLFVGIPRTNLEAMQKSVVTYFVLAGLCAGLLMIALGAYVARALSKPLGRATEYAQAVAAGDFNQTLTVAGKDEVGTLAKALGLMVDNLKAKIAESEAKSREAADQAEKATKAMAEAQVATEKAESGRQAILRAAENVDQVVRRLSEASNQLNGQIENATRSAEVQREQVATSATAMSEMTSTVLEVARSASVASEGSERARGKAMEGSGVVNNSVSAIGKVSQETLSLRDGMRSLGEQAESIGDIMTVISDIADQTNLLALNAAIEAARAGEAGRGFAVVADEVRKLAEKTMTATKEVGEAISGIQQGTRSSMEAVDSTSRNLEAVTGLVGQSGSALSEIVSESVATADQVRSIATAAEEQSAASEEISHSLEEINRLASDTAGIMRQSAEAVTELTQQVNTLEKLVDELRKG